MHNELRNFLDSCSANLQQHSSHQFINTLAHGLYGEMEGTRAAVDTTWAMIAAVHRHRTDLNNSPTAQSSTPSTRIYHAEAHPAPGKLAQNISKRLKERVKKFSGDWEESCMEFLDEYTHINCDHNLSMTQEPQYLHNLLHEDAKRYYPDKDERYATSFQQVASMLKDELNSPARLKRVNENLNSLRFSSPIAQIMDSSTALSKIYK